MTRLIQGGFSHGPAHRCCCHEARRDLSNLLVQPNMAVTRAPESAHGVIAALALSIAIATAIAVAVVFLAS